MVLDGGCVCEMLHQDCSAPKPEIQKCIRDTVVIMSCSPHWGSISQMKSNLAMGAGMSWPCSSTLPCFQKRVCRRRRRCTVKYSTGALILRQDGCVSSILIRAADSAQVDSG